MRFTFKRCKKLTQLFGRVLSVAMQARDVLRARFQASGNSSLDDCAVTAILPEVLVMQTVRASLPRDKRIIRPAGIVLRAVVNHKHLGAFHDCGRNTPQYICKSLRDVIGGNKDKVIGTHQ